MAKKNKLDNELYEAELHRLQSELVEMQEWVKATGARIVVLFEGRDAAGKGGAIKRISEYLNPRVAQVVALPAPTEREKTQWYFQRYIAHLPAAGEIRLFDRSWYNRAGVEKVMGYCTADEHVRFLRQVPIFERMLTDDGIMLRKYWFSVSDKEQERRFRSRMTDPMRRWKLSPTDLESIARWEEYSRAKDEMFVHTDIPDNRWNVVEAEDKKRARVNMVAHLLASVPYGHVPRPDIAFPKRPAGTGYRRTARQLQNVIPDYASTLHPDEVPPRYVDPEDQDLPKHSKKKKKKKKQQDAEQQEPRPLEPHDLSPDEGAAEATVEAAELAAEAAEAAAVASAEGHKAAREGRDTSGSESVEASGHHQEDPADAAAPQEGSVEGDAGHGGG